MNSELIFCTKNISFAFSFQVAIQWKNSAWIFVCIILSMHWVFCYDDYHAFWNGFFTWLVLVIRFYCRWHEIRFEWMRKWTEFDESETAIMWHCQSVFGCKRVEYSSSRSIEVQRILLIFMSGAQQSVLFRGYGNIECTRDAFENVSLSQNQFVNSCFKFECFFFIPLQLDYAHRIFPFNDASPNYWIDGFCEVDPNKGEIEQFTRRL